MVIFGTIAAPQDELHDYSQKDCIVRIAHGDKAALKSLYEQAKGSVYGYALSILKNPHDAEDVLQDTFVSVYASAHAYRPMQKPMAWVMTIARNQALMRLRQRGRRAATALEDCRSEMCASPAVTPEDSLVLKAALGSLSGEEMQIVILHAVSGFKHREIAQFLELPLSTILSKYSRALQKLKARLREESK